MVVDGILHWGEVGAALDPGVRMAVAVLAWLLGIARQMQQPQLWPVAGHLVVLSLVLALLVSWRAIRGRWPSVALACLVLALALAAFASTGLRAAQRLAPTLAAALEGQELQLTGVIARMPQAGAQGTRFVFDVDTATLNGHAVPVPQRVSLGWYRGYDDRAADIDTMPTLRAGRRWLLTARLRRPHGSLNPHGFDFELWLFEQGVRATGTVRTSSAAANLLLAEDVGHPVERARQSVRDALRLYVPDGQSAGVLAALAVGDQAAIDGRRQKSRSL